MYRLSGIMGEAYSALAWATNFIDVADERWNVVENRSFAQHGSSFQPSFRRGVMVAQLDTVRTWMLLPTMPSTMSI